jgi:hypothetical protein
MSSAGPLIVRTESLLHLGSIKLGAIDTSPSQAAPGMPGQFARTAAAGIQRPFRISAWGQKVRM